MKRVTSTMEAYRDGYPYTQTFTKSKVGYSKDVINECIQEVKAKANCNCEYVINPRSLVFCYTSADYNYTNPESINNKVDKIIHQVLAKYKE